MKFKPDKLRLPGNARGISGAVAVQAPPPLVGRTNDTRTKSDGHDRLNRSSRGSSRATRVVWIPNAIATSRVLFRSHMLWGHSLDSLNDILVPARNSGIKMKIINFCGIFAIWGSIWNFFKEKLAKIVRRL